MFVLDSVACADTFPTDGQQGGAQIVAQNGSTGGYASVAGNDVLVQLGYTGRNPGGSATGIVEWTPGVHVGVGNIILAPGTYGIRFRNYVAGKIATVSAGLSEPYEPPIQLTSGGVSAASSGSVTELGYAEITAPVSTAATTEPGAVQVIALPAISVDGATKVIVEFFAPNLASNVGGSGVQLSLRDGVTILGDTQSPADVAGRSSVGWIRREYTPAAGSHTWAVYLYNPGGGGATVTVNAGAGGSGIYLPAYLRVSTV